MFGDNYPPAAWRSSLAWIVSTLKLLLIVVVGAGVGVEGGRVAAALGQRAALAWSWMSQNRLYACLMLFFLGNFVESQLMSTGAFEVSLNGMPVWSKLETGRVPSPPELLQIIDNQLRWAQTETSPSGTTL